MPVTFFPREIISKEFELVNQAALDWIFEKISTTTFQVIYKNLGTENTGSKFSGQRKIDLDELMDFLKFGMNEQA